MDEEKKNKMRCVKTPWKHKRASIITLVMVFLIAAGLLVWIFVINDEDEGNVQIGSMPGKEAESLAAMQKEVDEGMLAISVNAYPLVEKGEADFMIENPANNTKNVIVDIRVNDTGQLLYKSPTLKPNSYILKMPLLAKLPSGKYECTATFHSLDPDTSKEIGKAQAGIVLTVQ